MTTDGQHRGEAGSAIAASEGSFPEGLALVLGSTLTVMAILLLVPAIPEFLLHFQAVPAADVWVPAMVSVAALGAAAFAPFAGLVGDRFGCRVPLICCCLAFAGLGTAPYFLDNFWAIFATRLGCGVAYTGILVLSTAMIGEYFTGSKATRWLSGQAVAATASALVFLPLGGLLTSALGWRGPFLAFLVGVPFALTYWLLFRGERHASHTGGSRVGWSALPWRWLLPICLLSVVVGIAAFALQMQIGLALAAVGVKDVARIGLLSGLASVGIPVGAACYIFMASWPFRRLVSCQMVVLGVTMVLLGRVEDQGVFVAIAFVNLVASGMVLPTFITKVAQNIDPAVRARGIGLWQASFPISQFLAPTICSQLALLTGGTILDALWLLGGGAVLLGVTGLVAGFFKGAEGAPLPAPR